MASTIATKTTPATARIRLRFGVSADDGAFGCEPPSLEDTRLSIGGFDSSSSVSVLRVSFSLGIERLHLSGCAGQVRARLVVAVKRGDLIVVGARQRILRLDQFDVVGHAGRE